MLAPLLSTNRSLVTKEAGINKASVLYDHKSKQALVEAVVDRAKVLEALEDTRPDVDDADAEARFRERRAAALHKAPAQNR